MGSSMILATAQISFLPGRLSLIHIPTEYYPFFLQPILRLLFGEDHDEDAAKISWTYRHQFLNISITPVECSVVCSRELADRFFRPLAGTFNHLAGSKKKSEGKERVLINPEDFIVVQVDGQGLDAGQRVLELTSPLAMAGISIFFKTTYFSDYILVPARARQTVTNALEQRGFVFSHSASAFVSQLSPSSPIPHHSRQQSSSSSFEIPAPPATPPAKDVEELQKRTFARLKRANIIPSVDRSIRLVSCAGRREPDPALDAQLRNDLLQVLLATCPGSRSKPSSSSRTGLGLSSFEDDSPSSHDQDSSPDFSTRFLSLTLTDTEPISVLLEHSLLPVLGASLLGSKSDEDVLVPIILDLRDLPQQSTGIVCGVAGRLAHGTSVYADEGALEGQEAVEISYLSTAMAGTVIVKETELDRAVRALKEDDDGKDA